MKVFLELVTNCRVHEICQSRRTCPANFGNVRRRAVVKFNQMSCKKLEMSSEAQNNFAYSADCFQIGGISQPKYDLSTIYSYIYSLFHLI